MKEPIRNKRRMYDLLNTGALGNTLPCYWSLKEWQESGDYARYPLWGVRVTVPGDPRMRLNIPRAKVHGYVEQNFPDAKGFNISPMIDPWVILKGEVTDLTFAPFGLYAYLTQAVGPWRETLRDHGKHYHGLAVRLLLESYMDPASYDDVCTLLAEYPGHVVEFSVCDRHVGIAPHRNTVIWEVRQY